MCLYIDKTKTIQEKQNKAARTVYKIYLRDKGTLQTPYMKHTITNPGIQVPVITGLEIEGIITGGAFHARTREDSFAQDFAWISQFQLGFSVVLAIRVLAEDIIAYGNQDNVAFRRYELTQKMWDDAFKARRDREVIL
jgi:hypothetical protein